MKSKDMKYAYPKKIIKQILKIFQEQAQGKNFWNILILLKLVPLILMKKNYI